MKKFVLKNVSFWLLICAVGVTAIAGVVNNVNASDDEDRSWPTTEYLLVRDLELDTANDSLHTIGKPENETLTLTTGFITLPNSTNAPRCGSKCSNSTCNGAGITNDTIYPASGQTYYGSFLVAASGNNSREGRIPKNVFSKGTSSINPGKKMTGLVLVTEAFNTDGICYHLDAGETWTFRKYRVTMD